MRVALFGLNLVALVAAVFPGVLIFEAVSQNRGLDPISRETFFVLLGAGATMCLVAAAALTKHRRPDPELAARLLSIGGLLFTGAIGWAVALYVWV
jgi:hypothetical protein